MEEVVSTQQDSRSSLLTLWLVCRILSSVGRQLKKSIRQVRVSVTLSPQFLVPVAFSVMDKRGWRGDKVGIFTVLLEVAEV